jgi:hypothetical protein
MYTEPMKPLMIAALVVLGSIPLTAQEREVPKDSARLVLQGCAKGRTFIVGPRTEHSPGNLEIEPGRRFRLNGSRRILDEIKKREATMVEVTGLVRKSQVSGPGGISIAGGRIRIGGAMPQDRNPTRNAAYNEVVIDLEGWRSLAESCPDR